MKNLITRNIRNIFDLCINNSSYNSLQIENTISSCLKEIAEILPDAPILYGFKVYSQVDEDGIIEHILGKIGTEFASRTFIEIGCGNGLENNTHYLALKKYKGVWVDGNSQNIAYIHKHVPILKNTNISLPLLVKNKFITRDNIENTIDECCKFLKTDDVDFFSFDTDGNDLLVVHEALCHFRPKVVCVEYNAKFPPNMDIAIARDDKHSWSSDDYFGASLLGFVNSFSGYRLVSCNISGANAFFVRNDLAPHFPSYSIGELYRPARYQLIHRKAGHTPSLGFLKNVIEETANSGAFGTIDLPRQERASARDP